MRNLIKQISTPRLILRKFEIKDAEDFQSLLARNKEYMLPWIPWAKKEPQSIEEKKAKIREWNGQFLLDTTYSYGIYYRTRLIGSCNLFTRQGKDILEIGYLIDHLESGKGYATECTYALTKLAFEHIHIDKLVLHMDPKNVASARIPKKLNYTLETTKKVVEKNDDGSRVDEMIWAMFIEDFIKFEKYEQVSFLKEDGW